ncbi:ATP-binding protein [Bdellovibrionota bacterium FG-1]
MRKFINLSFIQQLEHNIKLNTGLLQVIIGPRQVGKTTTILEYLEHQHAGRFHYVSADAVFHASHDWLAEQWQIAFQQRKLLVVDEIQKCENWSETIKTLWDQFKREKKTLTCILLGSSSLQIQKGLTESLTGRFQLIKVFHWNACESKRGYGLSFEDYLRYGGYPGSYPLIKTNDWTGFVKQSIISTVIEKDILQYQNVKSPALFKQAFEILISYPAQEISYTKLLGQIQDKGNTDLIKYYISLYEGAFLIKALEKFSEKTIKVKSSSPKILPLAPCLYYLSVLDQYDGTERGRAFELAVGAQLVRADGDLYYWREGDFEVDFVLKVGRNIYAIEVKSGRKKKKSGLLQFKEKYPRAKMIFITPENYELFESDPMVFLVKMSG